MDISYVDGIIKLNYDEIILVAPQKDAVEAIPFHHSVPHQTVKPCVTDDCDDTYHEGVTYDTMDESDTGDDEADDDDEESVVGLNRIVNDDAREDENDAGTPSRRRTDYEAGRHAPSDANASEQRQSAGRGASARKSRIFKLPRFLRRSLSGVGSDLSKQRHPSLCRNLAFEEDKSGRMTSTATVSTTPLRTYYDHSSRSLSTATDCKRPTTITRKVRSSSTDSTTPTTVASSILGSVSGGSKGSRGNTLSEFSIFQFMCDATSWGTCGTPGSMYTTADDDGDECAMSILNDTADHSEPRRTARPRDSLDDSSRYLVYTPAANRDDAASLNELHWEDRVVRTDDIMTRRL